MILVGMVLGFLMPSGGSRVLLLLPVAMTLADGVDLRRGTKGRTGIVLATALGTFLTASAVLPTNVPSMMMAGAAGTQFGVIITYAGYLPLHFPVLALIKLLLLFELILVLFPATEDHRAAVAPAVHAGRARALRRGSASPPRSGACAPAPVLPPRALDEQVGYGVLFFVAGILVSPRWWPTWG